MDSRRFVPSGVPWNATREDKKKLKHGGKDAFDMFPIESEMQNPGSLDFCANFDVMSRVAHLKMTKIVCTIGPSTQDVETLIKLMKAGMDVARLNFSHGTHEYHKQSIDNIRAASEQAFGSCGFAIALDTKGPEIRTGKLENGNKECELVTGSTVTVTTDPEFQNSVSDKLIYVDYPKLCKLRVSKIDPQSAKKIECIVENGGTLKSQKGVNLPGIPVDLPAITEKDKDDLVFGVQNDVDFIFASFVRDGAGIRDIRQILSNAGGSQVKIIAKIENEQGLLNADEIIDAADGVMVARGDMGVEIDPEKVYLAQRMLIARCQKIGKPVICATQMLDSMTRNPRPTRAEVSDVAFAVAEGSDAVMLSSETASGLYPIETVEMQVRIAKLSETTFPYMSRLVSTAQGESLEPTQSIALAAVHCAFTSRAVAIVVLTTNGHSAWAVSRYRPRCPVVCVTRNLATARSLALCRNCYLRVMQPEDRLCYYTDDVEMRIQAGVQFVNEQIIDTQPTLPKPTDRHYTTRRSDRYNIVVITGARPGYGYINVMRIITVSRDGRD